MSERRGFRVLIAGGGVAGLTLANALERGGVDYVLLERRGELAPQVGASIGMLSNGARILDQLGVYGAILAQNERALWASDRDKNGHLLAPRSDFARLGTARTGYELSFGDRQVLLQALSDGIKDKSKILRNKKIIDVIHSADRVSVKCEDGTVYDGDILVGADGVRSKTREALWRLAGKEDPESVQRDKNAMTAEYQCLFGICSQIPGMDIGDLDYGYDKDRSSLVVVMKEGRTYYFIFQKLDQVLHGTEMPHYSREDEEEFVRAHANMMIRPDIPFEKLWEKTISSNLVVLEEATFATWTWGRIACMGDSVHKMTPNVGYGGNAAIESAAAMASAIKEMVDKTDEPHPTESQIKRAFASYQDVRQKRADTVVRLSARVTRLQALQTASHRFFVRYCLRFLGDSLTDMASDMIVGATCISYLPIPRQSVQGSMPFNPAQGEGKKESKLARAMLALPFLFLAYFAKKLMDPAPLIPLVSEIISTGKLPWRDTPIMTSFYNLKWLDDMLAPLVVFFSPALIGLDTVSPQAFLFLVDYGVILSIWLVESARRANSLTLVQLPVVFTLVSQFIGVGVISPLYYTLHYVFSPIENFKATDMRLTQTSYTKAILPSLILAYYVPLYSAFHGPSFSGRVSWAFFWQLFPLWLSILASQMLSRLFRDTTAHDRIHKPTSDLPAIRITVGLLSLHSAVGWLFIWANTAGFSVSAMLRLVLPSTHSPQIAADLATFATEFFRFDSAFLFANTFLWLGYLFWDIKHAGMLKLSWVWIMLFALGATAALGPGAAAGLGWLWREELLATKKHRAALTEEVAREWNQRLGYRWPDEKVDEKTGRQ